MIALIRAKNTDADAMRNQLTKFFAILLLCVSCANEPIYHAENIHDLALGDNIITLDSGDVINIQKGLGHGILDDGEIESFAFCEVYFNDIYVSFKDDYSSLIETKYDYNKECETQSVLFEYTPEFLLLIEHRDAANNCTIEKTEQYRISDYKFIKI